MTAPIPSVLTWSAAALRQWLGGGVPADATPADAAPADAGRFLREQRLEILASAWLPGLCSPAEYARHALFHQRLLSVGAGLAARLESAGIPCLCLRGPFAAARLYPDPAERPFRDLDLLIPRRQAREALRELCAAGFRLEEPRMPAGYFLRNHLHWMTIRDRDGIVCDLHWAVEHRFRPYRIDLDALFSHSRMVEARGHSWREPAPGHLFLLGALHARKHLPAGFDPHDATTLLFFPGCLFQWLDLALMSRSAIDWERVAELAAEWNIQAVAGLAVRQLHHGFGIRLPDPMASLEALAPASAALPPAWARRLAFPVIGRMACFRTSKVADAVEYIARPHPSGRRVPTALRRAGALLRVGAAAADTLVCAGWAGLGRKPAPPHHRPATP